MIAPFLQNNTYYCFDINVKKKTYMQLWSKLWAAQKNKQYIKIL